MPFRPATAHALAKRLLDQPDQPVEIYQDSSYSYQPLTGCVYGGVTRLYTATSGMPRNLVEEVIERRSPVRFSTPFGFTSLIDHDGLDYHHNRDYHCPQCGKVWARWERDTLPDDPSMAFYPYRRSCPAHPTGAWQGDFPGSQLLYPADIAIMPRLLLIQELLLRTSPQGDLDEQ